VEDGMSAEWINYKDKKIIYINYMGLKPAEMSDLVKQATQMIVASKSNDVLSLSNVTDCFLTRSS
jgi:hypothetical protein